MADHPTRPEIDLLAGEFYASDPHDLYRWMRTNAPVYFDEANGVWGIACYRDLKVVERNPNTFSSAGGAVPGMGPMPMMIDMDDPDHARRRKLVSKGFTPRRVRDLEAKIRAVCDEIIDAVYEKGSCDLVRDIAAPLPMVMIGDALGVAPEDRADLLTWSDDMVSAQSNKATDEALMAAATAFLEYQAYATKVIAERRTRPVDIDLMSVLVHAEVDGDMLDDDELMQESLLILVGGDETTRHVVSGGIAQLVRNPDQRQKLLDRPELLGSTVEEMLRWVTPIKTMSRVATEDTELRGQQLRKGQEVVLLYHSANRDEEIFDRPFEFDIERSPNDHVAFGFGTHFCLGASLARLEVSVMTERLMARMPDLELAGPTPMRPANFITGFESMPVRWTP
ncbi:MAG: cytochrome P450 [Acidimicrobiia bacterium]|nr:cytochrome P450 [Acidimicrobiia bacterium]